MQNKKEINVALGRRLQLTRESRGYTQEALAEMLDVGVQHISNIERGVTGISLTALVRVCDVLDVSADFLLLGVYAAHHAASIDDRIQKLPPRQGAMVEQSINQMLDALALSNKTGK